MNRYWVTATVVGCYTVQHSIFADSPGEAQRAFNSKYPGREVIHTKCKRADIEVTRSMRVPA